MLGAYLGFLGVYELHSEWVGFMAGIAGGLAGAVVMVLLSVRMGLDQIVVGIAITLAGEGITSVLQQAHFKGKFPGLGNPATVAIPGLSRLPVAGHSLFDQPLLVYLGIGLLALVAWVFRSTSWGLNLRPAGENRRRWTPRASASPPSAPTPCSPPARWPGSAARTFQSSGQARSRPS